MYQDNYSSEIFQKSKPNTLIYTRLISRTKVAVYTKINSFKLGEIDFVTKTFTSVSRTSKNLFRLFGNGGLGLDASLLSDFDFVYINIPYNGKILSTTKTKWLKRGIASPYCSGRVNKQIIMRLEDINMMDAEETGKDMLLGKKRERDSQLNLFS